MRRVVFLTLMMIISVIVLSQTATDEMISYNKRNVSGVSIIVSEYDVKLTAEAMQFRMEQVAGLKGATMKGFRYYQSQPFSDFGNLNYDIYTKVTTTGKKKEQKTIIYLLVSTGNENFITPASDPQLTGNVKNFLNHFVTVDLRQYDIDKKSNEQDRIRIKLEKETQMLSLEIIKLKEQLETKEKIFKEKQNELIKVKNTIYTLKSVR
jgi:hypothetical protein